MKNNNLLLLLITLNSLFPIISTAAAAFQILPPPKPTFNFSTPYIPLHRRASLEVPDRVKSLCDECEKKGYEGGSCGAGLKCLCHPHLCRDKVVYGDGRKMGASVAGRLFVGCFVLVWILVLGV
ncbi:hypothetical protein LINPERPRIM_LOCUS8018 [Linum perenne]